MADNKLTPVTLDSTTRRQLIRAKAVQGLEGVFPLKTKNYTLEMANPRIKEQDYSSREQKQAILEGRTLNERLVADVTVKNNAGDVVDHVKGFTLVHLPYFTPRHTFILAGNEYNVANQIRPKPGVYTRRRGNEDLEATFNLAKGANFRIAMDPAKALLHMQYQTTNIPLYPVLNALGVPHADIAKAWGPEVADINRFAFKKPEKHITRLYEKLIYPTQQTAQTHEARIGALHEYFDKTRMDPEVTQRTLGTGFDKASPMAMLAASKKLLDVHRAAEDTDDRDSLEFKTFHQVDDLIKERIGLDARMLKLKMGIKLDAAKGKLRDAIPAAPFSKSLNHFLTNSKLTSVPMQINPMELLDQSAKVTSLGEGGISSDRAIPLETRALHTSHLGIFDPVRTPECHDDQTEVYTSKGWKRWPDVTMQDFLACNINERLEFHHPLRLIAEPYTGMMYGMKSGKVEYLVTPNHRVYCRPIWYFTGQDKRPGQPEWRIECADDVHGKAREFETSHWGYDGEDVKYFELPLVKSRPKVQYPSHGGFLTDTTKNIEKIAMDDWAAFMGWWLSEGSCWIDEKSGRYSVNISQSLEANPETYQAIEALLRRLPFTYSKDHRGFTIRLKQLAVHLHPFGYCNDKYIPEYFFGLAYRQRERLLDCLLLGDGRIDSQRSTGKHYWQDVLCTTSPRLAIDVERLAISLGIPVRTRMYKDKREERYLPVYEVRMLKDRRRQAWPRKGHYRTIEYSGMVYCAEVPGHLLYTRRNGSVPVWTGNSGHAGIDIRTALWARRDDKGNLYAPVINVKSGKQEFLRPGEMLDKTVAFPGEDLGPGRMVDAMKAGQVVSVSSSTVTHQIPHGAALYGPTTNLLPVLHGMQANRSIMASKHQGQALSLVHREQPLVQVKSWDGERSVEEEMARLIVPTAPIGGRIAKIDKDYIYIEPHTDKAAAFTSLFDCLNDDVYSDFMKLGADEGLIKLHYDTNFPLAAKTYLHNTLKVKEGDEVHPGQPLADSNFTKNDALALGTNLKVGYMAYRGLNTNDGIVISQGAADKLTSEHMYKTVMQLDPDVTASREKHRTYYGIKYTAAQYKNLDDEGVVRPGTIVHPSDLLIAAVRKNELTGDAALLGKLSKSLLKPFREQVELWDHESPGEVMDVVKMPTRITVTVKTQEHMGVGDKLAGRFGNKGVIAKIVPDHQMVQDGNGKPIDLLFTSAGIISRVNPAQVVEAALGKVAAHTGKPIKFDNFAHRDNVQYAKDLLAKHGLKDKETVYDPITQKSIPGVFVGNSYILKIFKTTDSNWASHGAEKYDINQQPARGGDEGAKAIGKMEFDGLVAHNARNILREAASLKSQKNDEFWRAVQLGLPTPSPSTTFAYDKFLNLLQAGGVKVSKAGSKLTLGPMTDADIRKMSSGIIPDPNKRIRAKDLQPEIGGLFDPALTGGMNGTKWTHVDLHEPIVNPVFEEPVRRLLGLTQKQFDELHAKHGGSYFKRELGKIDVAQKIDDLKTQSKGLNGAKLDNAVKQIKYLMALDAAGLKPEKAYVLSAVPVAPPIVRPILPLPNGQLITADANDLYKDAFLANKKLGELKDILPDAELQPLRAHMYQAVGAVFGTHEAVSKKLAARGAKGFLNQITGSRPGNGFFQAKLMKRQQDVSGRATIAPDPTLAMDEVGVPEEMLWGMFGKFVIARLVQKGYGALEAQKMVDEKAYQARQELLMEAKERPVIVNRAPSLHRFSLISAYPKIIDGKTLKLNPFAEKGLNADYDGDALQIHAPVTAAGIADAKKMTLSNLIFSDRKANSLNVSPDMESVIGLHRATQAAKDIKAKTFDSHEAAMQAYHAGSLKLSDPISIRPK